MGTRADFYVGRGPEAEWLGSIAWDGYPDGNPADAIHTTDEADWRQAVAELLALLDHATLPEQGWPWPWETSHSTDFAYAFDDGRVLASRFGHAWFDPTVPMPDDENEDDDPKLPADAFPAMSARRVKP